MHTELLIYKNIISVKNQTTINIYTWCTKFQLTEIEISLFEVPAAYVMLEHHKLQEETKCSECSKFT